MSVTLPIARSVTSLRGRCQRTPATRSSPSFAGLQALADTLALHADDIDAATAQDLLAEVDAVADALHKALD